MHRDCSTKKQITKTVIILLFSFLLPKESMASFIETTMGTAVVNDATASYFNPAALLQLKNTQIIPLMTLMQYRTSFNGTVTTASSGFSQSGTANATSWFYSPSFYAGLPLNKKVTLGLAFVSHFVNRDPDENSILETIQPGNSIQDYTLVPGFGMKLNDILSVGAGLVFSYTRLSSSPTPGLPGTSNPNVTGTNQSSGSGIGGNIGFLLKPRDGTLIGLNYRTQISYPEKGTSRINGPTPLTSSGYQFQLTIPARATLSLAQQLTKNSKLIMTVQHINWNHIKTIQVNGVTTLIGTTSVITHAVIPEYLKNTWILTLGDNYRFKPDWILRVAGTFNESPGNSSYQITEGNSYILLASLGHDINKILTVDVGYAHAFIQDASIHTNGQRVIINGINSASRDAASLKLTVNVV
ncbi:MAG TPA: outer membrane protein transport protein [Gammaproteobacteria bacterium]|nr:outer membrane protein transport protein [Gammaproteobacteria bacterium]